MTRQLPLPLPCDASMEADDFLVTSCNREAALWVERWPNWPAHGLVVTGLSGSGKTHLASLWGVKSGARFVSRDALLGQDSLALTEAGLTLILDDADVWAGHAEAEERLFHLYNHLKTAKGFLLVTMKRGAGQAGFVLPDLRSRLLALPSVSLGAPDDDLLQALIVKQFRDRQISLDTGVVSYLAARIPRDAASIRNTVEKLDLAALAEGRKITIVLARKILENLDD